MRGAGFLSPVSLTAVRQPLGVRSPENVVDCGEWCAVEQRPVGISILKVAVPQRRDGCAVASGVQFALVLVEVDNGMTVYCTAWVAFGRLVIDPSENIKLHKTSRIKQGAIHTGRRAIGKIKGGDTASTWSGKQATDRQVPTTTSKNHPLSKITATTESHGPDDSLSMHDCSGACCGGKHVVSAGHPHDQGLPGGNNGHSMGVEVVKHNEVEKVKWTCAVEGVS
eukprot:6490447-Amphidinium_carterae.5